MAERRSNPVLHWMGGRLPGAAARRVQVAAYATEWEAANADALAEGGPLWVALGDSTAQGIGATSRRDGYVLQLLERLRSGREPTLGVVNLSRTGALVRDVLDEQLARSSELPAPALVTCAIGANDLLRAPRSLISGLRELAAALPTGSILATLPQGIRTRGAQAANEVVRAEAGSHGLVVAELWAHTGPPWRGKFSADGFHPNDRGYEGWVEAFAEALEGEERPP